MKTTKNIVKKYANTPRMLNYHFIFVGQKFMSAVSWKECVGENISLLCVRAIGNTLKKLIRFIQIIE